MQTEQQVQTSLLRERKLADAAKLRLAAIVNSSDDAIIGKLLHGGITSWNQGAERMFGYSAEEMIGQPIAVIFPPECLKEELEMEVRSGRGERLEHFETVRLRKDGQRVDVSVTNSPDLDSHSNIIGSHSVTRNITERKGLTDKVSASENRYRRLFESARDGIFILDAENGKIVDANPYLVEILGYSHEEFMDKELWEVGLFKDIDENKAAFDELQANEYIRYDDLPLETKDGRRINVEFVSNVYIEDGQKVIQCNIRDITARRKLEAQSRQSQKMEGIGQLASGVAHDFNNILAAIQMQAELLKYGENLSPEHNALADEIVEAVERAAALTRQLLLFSRKEVLREEDLDLNQSIENMLKMLGRTLGDDIEVQLKLAGQAMWLHADPGMLDQVLLNLGVNARDAMPGGGQVVVETFRMEFDEEAASQSEDIRPGSFVCLSVSDNGCGIPPEVQSKIFEPFFTTKEVGKGTGLGLATVFGIVKQHRGWINVYSEVGQGTTFRIYLPRLADPSEMKPPEPISTTLPGGKETILLVEDGSSLRKMLNLSLSHLGYQVLEASDGMEALAVWNAHRDEIQLVLTDMVMPGGMNGIELGAHLLKEDPKVKVIYASGYSAEVAGKDFPLKEGVNFLNKPFQSAKLAQTVRAMLDT
jgi:PAS domain S-box-containing protein